MDCAVDIAGATDLTIPWSNPDDDVNTANLLGGTHEEVPDAYRDFSVVTHVDKDTVPFLILHGTGDTFLPVEHSRRLEDVLHEAGVEVIYGEFADIDHLEWSWAPSAPWTLALLERHLRA